MHVEFLKAVFSSAVTGKFGKRKYEVSKYESKH